MPTKNALIIGGTSGLGLGVAEQLLQRDITTIIVGRRDFQNKNSPLLHHIKADLFVPEAISKVMTALNNRVLDYVVFSAATEKPLKPFASISVTEYDATFLLNLKVPFFLVQSLLNSNQLSTRARLLFISSRLSRVSEEGSIVYCMTKSALETLSAGLSHELPKGMLTASIIPGAVDTEMQSRLRNADPIVFRQASYYQKMQKKLQTVEAASRQVVEHLCDTNDAVYARQCVTLR